MNIVGAFQGRIFGEPMAIANEPIGLMCAALNQSRIRENHFFHQAERIKENVLRSENKD